MKTNTLKVILSAIAVSAIGLTVVSKASVSDLLPDMAVAISYVAVAAIVAGAAFDNRSSSKRYESR